MTEPRHAQCPNPLETGDTSAAARSAGAPPQAPQRPQARPYAITGDRTRLRYHLAIEALVTTTGDHRRLPTLLPEHQRICHLCGEARSVAEVSALLNISLNVARTLIADLAEAGMVTIHQPGGTGTSAAPDATLLKRVLSGRRNDAALIDGYRILVNDLDEVLDAEGGLREVLLQAHNDATIGDLEEVLDIETGLREAMREQSDDT